MQPVKRWLLPVRNSNSDPWGIVKSGMSDLQVPLFFLFFAHFSCVCQIKAVPLRRFSRKSTDN